MSASPATEQELGCIRLSHQDDARLSQAAGELNTKLSNTLTYSYPWVNVGMEPDVLKAVKKNGGASLIEINQWCRA